MIKTKKNKNLLSIIILIMATSLVLFFSLKDNYNEILFQIMNINKIWLSIAFILLLGCWITKSIVLRYQVIKINPNFTHKKSLLLIIKTDFFHAITPFAVGGQPFQIYMLKKEGLKLSEATNVAIQNFILYQIALLLSGTFAIICNNVFNIFPIDNLLRYIIIISFLTDFLVIVGLLTISYSKKLNRLLVNLLASLLVKLNIIKDKEEKLRHWHKALDNFHQGSTTLFQNKGEFFLKILIYILSFICIYSIPLALFYGMGEYYNINLFNTIISSSYVMLIGSSVPIPGGTGGFEFGFIVFFGSFIKSASLTATMLLWRFITYYFTIIICPVIFYIDKKTNIKI